MLYDAYFFYFYPYPDPLGRPRETEGNIILSYWPTAEQLAKKIRAKALEWEQLRIPLAFIEIWAQEVQHMQLPVFPKPGYFTEEISTIARSIHLLRRK